MLDKMIKLRDLLKESKIIPKDKIIISYVKDRDGYGDYKIIGMEGSDLFRVASGKASYYISIGNLNSPENYKRRDRIENYLKSKNIKFKIKNNDGGWCWLLIPKNNILGFKNNINEAKILKQNEVYYVTNKLKNFYKVFYPFIVYLEKNDIDNLYDIINDELGNSTLGALNMFIDEGIIKTNEPNSFESIYKNYIEKIDDVTKAELKDTLNDFIENKYLTHKPN
jgi:hypothetical protein